MNFRALLVGITLLAKASSPFAAEENKEPAKDAKQLRIVASLAPVHSIVSSVMQGVGKPALLLKSNVSPHLAHLKPSQAELIENADLFIWIGPKMETFLKRPLEARNASRPVLTLADVPSVQHHKIRKAGLQVSAEHHDSEEHDHEHDMHIWLDPQNGISMAFAIADQLGKTDPVHKDLYRANAEKLEEQLKLLSGRIETRLEAVRGRPYLVLHDAYQAFEERFDFPPAGTISVSPEQRPGPRHINEMQKIVSTGDIACIFTEPQQTRSWIDTIINDAKIRKGSLDPLGSSLDPGPDLYLNLLEDLSVSLHDCLKE